MNLGNLLTESKLMQKRPVRNLTFIVVFVMVYALLTLVTSSVAKADEANGKIAGQVINKDSGEPLVGATVAIKGTSLGAICDLDGNYRIKNVPEGTYTLTATSVGFTTIEMNEVVVTSGEMTPLNFIMSPQVLKTEGIKVEATVNNNTQAVLLHQRKNAAAVTDGISAQEIARSGGSDAAEAMTKVTGASVVDGKFVFVRGLGDRYANTQLNGSTLPSPDPDKQAVPMDLFPTGLLDYIIVEKSFTPDKPGDFAGGSVNLTTKDYPETRSLTLTTSTGSNSVSRYGEEALTQTRSSTDWLGHDDGLRAIPQIIQDNPDLQNSVPQNSFINISQNGLADSMVVVDYMDQAARSFRPEMTPHDRKIPLDQSYSFSYGDQLSILSRPLGVVASLSYSSKFNSSTGFRGTYIRRANTQGLNPNYEFQDTFGSEEVLWGGLVNLNYGIHPNHKIGWNYIRTRNGQSKSEQLIGPWYEYTDNDIRNNALWYTERELTANQFNGSHSLFDNKVRADWKVSFSDTRESEPDIRLFADEVQIINSQSTDSLGNPITVRDTIYSIQRARFRAPQRFWRDLKESNNEYLFNFTIPLSTKSKYKGGVAVLNKTRQSVETRFQYLQTDSYVKYDGDINAFIRDMGLDTVTTRVFRGDTIYRFQFSNILQETSVPDNNYIGDKDIFAYYSMIEMPLMWSLYFSGGLRYETTAMSVKRIRDNLRLGSGIDEDDLLPSANLVYHVGEYMNLRAAYGRTLARPNLLEMSTAKTEEFNTSNFYLGNPNLKLTKIDNYDFRWEWFVRPGEIIAAGAFYKRLKNPIENTVLNINFDVQPRNAEDASVYGFELEFRRYLGFLFRPLSNFRFGGNFTWVKSEVKLTPDELEESRGVDPDFPDTRPLAGQSPFIVNLDLGYDNYGIGTSMSFFYNVFGRRLEYNSEGATPDVYEQPFHQLDFIGSQRFFGNAKLKVSVKNILNDDKEYIYDDLNGEITKTYYYKKYDVGVSYSVGLSYQVW